MKQHTYRIQMDWTGNDGDGTKTYRSYRRDHTLVVPGRTPIMGSSDPAFRGDPTRYNPEELLVGSLSSCHMLWYLHLCAVNDVVVMEYHDNATGFMDEADEGFGSFVRVELAPVVRIAAGSDPAKAHDLHAKAHHYCFISRSVNFPVAITPVIVASAPAP